MRLVLVPASRRNRAPENHAPGAVLAVTAQRIWLASQTHR